MENIYADIAARTGGNIYVGVVGPVRTGKSTLIKRIMEELVIPGSLKVIPERAFEFCGRLRKVRICSGVEVISADAFAECGELREIQMDEGVKQIHQRAFFRCGKLGKIRKGD